MSGSGVNFARPWNDRLPLVVHILTQRNVRQATLSDRPMADSTSDADLIARAREDVIQPRSDAQRDSIRPILEHVAQQNNRIIRDVNNRLRAALDSMRATLAPMLDQAQRDRLSAEIERMPDPLRPGGRGGRGGPAFGGPGGRGRGSPLGGRPDDRPPLPRSND